MVHHSLLVVRLGQSSSSVMLQSHCPQSAPKPISRVLREKVATNCCFENPIRQAGLRQVLSGVAALIVFLSQTNLAVAADFPQNNDLCQISPAMDSMPTLPLGKGNAEPRQMLTMMRGMTAKDFDPARYAGRWFEVASLNVDLQDKVKKIVIATRMYIHLIRIHRLFRLTPSAFMVDLMAILQG